MRSNIYIYIYSMGTGLLHAVLKLAGSCLKYPENVPPRSVYRSPNDPGICVSYRGLQISGNIALGRKEAQRTHSTPFSDSPRPYTAAQSKVQASA